MLVIFFPFKNLVEVDVLLTLGLLPPIVELKVLKLENPPPPNWSRLKPKLNGLKLEIL